MDCEATKNNILERMLLDASAEPTDLPLSLLEEITNDFSEHQQIGSGGFGVVYKGQLQNGTVAVKKLSQNLDVLEKNFYQEVSCLMKVRHKNIVRFLGYCANTQGKMCNYDGKLVMGDVQQRLLCFEFVPKGNLQQYITDASQGLEWSLRYQLIKGICEGLHYLHRNKILHLDLKPANVLIDYNMVPKIADFGLSRCFDENQSHAIASNVVGTLGYMAPEFLRGEIRSESDLYSLGVIIIEILTGQKGYSEIEDVLEIWSNRFGTSQGDTRLEQVRVCAEIGLQCIESDRKKRKTTQCILEKLDEMESRCSFIFNGISTSPVAHESWSWLEGITNVTVGVVVLVLILRSWVITIGVAVIVLLCLENSMSSWPEVIWVIVFGIGAVLLTVLVLMNSTAWSWVLLIFKLPNLIIITMCVCIKETAYSLGLVAKSANNSEEFFSLKNQRDQQDQLDFSLTKQAENSQLGSVFRTRLLVLIMLVEAFILAVRPRLEQEADITTFSAKVITGGIAKGLCLNLLNRRKWSWMTLLFTIVSILAVVLVLLYTSTSWSWVAVARTTMKAITPMNLMAIVVWSILLDDHDMNLQPWMVLLTIAVEATVINLVNNPMISLSLLVTVDSFFRFLVALLGIKFTTIVLLYILDIKSSWKRATLFAKGGLLVTVLNGGIVRFLGTLVGTKILTIALSYTLEIKSSWKQVIIFAIGVLLLTVRNGPIRLWSWLMVDSMTTLTLFALGFMAVILLPLLWSTSTSKLASLYPVVVALAADIIIVGGIREILLLAIFGAVSLMEDQETFDRWKEAAMTWLTDFKPMVEDQESFARWKEAAMTWLTDFKPSAILLENQESFAWWKEAAMTWLMDFKPSAILLLSV